MNEDGGLLLKTISEFESMLNVFGISKRHLQIFRGAYVAAYKGYRRTYRMSLMLQQSTEQRMRMID